MNFWILHLWKSGENIKYRLIATKFLDLMLWNIFRVPEALHLWNFNELLKRPNISVVKRLFTAFRESHHPHILVLQREVHIIVGGFCVSLRQDESARLPAVQTLHVVGEMLEKSFTARILYDREGVGDGGGGCCVLFGHGGSSEWAVSSPQRIC